MLIILLLKLALPNPIRQIERRNDKKGQIPLSEIVLSDLQPDFFHKANTATISVKKDALKKASF